MIREWAHSSLLCSGSQEVCAAEREKVYKSLMGRKKKMEDRVKTTAKIPTELWKQTKKKCLDEEIELADAINRALTMWIAAQHAAPKRKPA